MSESTEVLKPQKTHFYFHLPFATIVKVLLVLLFLACLKVLAPLMMTLFLATLLAVSLCPVVGWLNRKGIPRGISIAFLSAFLIAVIVTVAALLIPQLVQECTNFIANLPKFKTDLLNELSDSNPLRPFIKNFLNHQNLVPKTMDFAPLFSFGNMALSGLTELVLIFVFTVYLMIDGSRVIKWFSSFFDETNQQKINQTADEVSLIIYSYVAGQAITSIASFVYVWAALSYLQVPSALLLATLAGIFDVLPVLGFFFAVIPAMLFALSVSGSTALIVLALYIVYHGIENYFIVPAVYGKRLRVSSFVVLVTLIAAGLLAGVEGAIAALPIVASYPIIERIWLRRFVGQKTVAQHQLADAE
ncbi:MAG: AI-2E family transporter [Bdellovibrio sp.]|nr:AI-2E family transporter [Bdellovibrio sp.]